MYTQLEETHNIVCIYREECHDYSNRQCPCEPWDLPNMAEEFFDHLKEKHASRGDPSRAFELNMKDDFITFRNNEIQHCLRGWKPFIAGIPDEEVLNEYPTVKPIDRSIYDFIDDQPVQEEPLQKMDPSVKPETKKNSLGQSNYSI